LQHSQGQDEETKARRAALARALDTLPARERKILETRRLSEPPMTLHELSRALGVSRERIRQVEQRAVARVQSVAQSILMGMARGGGEMAAA
jgi:RNA polymerase sigma-32 factor